MINRPLIAEQLHVNNVMDATQQHSDGKRRKGIRQDQAAQNQSQQEQLRASPTCALKLGAVNVASRAQRFTTRCAKESSIRDAILQRVRTTQKPPPTGALFCSATNKFFR
jgi:hypothetical protein